ncbi:uncharacterized protein TrAFT101_003651 [Trichoderma asperellum]|uniref:uncharacterized protein n=1 Tax=Trichoderma asperellum TaxID=101201 RepID=UPI003326CDDD|nr:hypothetical protein TrAFT101_003651 [Trichoderma asperellum]
MRNKHNERDNAAASRMHRDRHSANAQALSTAAAVLGLENWAGGYAEASAGANPANTSRPIH